MDSNKIDNKFEYEKFLVEAISLDSQDWFGERAVGIFITSRITRRYSFILRVTAKFRSQETKNLIIKVPRDPSMMEIFQPITSKKIQQEANMEAMVLSKIYQSVMNSGDPSLAAIKIFGYYPQLCAVVMEELNMKILSDDLKTYPYHHRTLEAVESFLFRVMGGSRWLRYFHEANGLEQISRLGDSFYLDQVTAAFHRLENASGLILDQLRSDFSKAYESIKGDPVEVAVLHNDFHLGNVFVTIDEKIGVFDPNSSTRGPVFQDVSRMLIDLESRRIQVLSLGTFYRKSLLKNFNSSVLEGYFGPQTINQKFLKFFCALELLKKWRVNEEYFADHQNNIIKGLKSIVLPLNRRYFRKLISKYLAFN